MLIGVGRPRAGVGSTIYSGSATERRHHDKGIQGSATIHPNVVGQQGRQQGQRTGSLLSPTPDRVELDLLEYGILYSSGETESGSAGEQPDKG